MKVKKKRKNAHPTPNPESDNSSFDALALMISKLTESLDTLGNMLEKRISDIEGNVEKRLTVKFNTVITDGVKNEVDELKGEITSKVNGFKDKVETFEKSDADVVASNNGHTVQKITKSNFNVIVKKLPVDQHENSNSGLKSSYMSN